MMRHSKPELTDEARAILCGAMPDRLSKVVSVFQKWLYLPDLSALKVTLAAAAANLMVGDALWLLLVGTTGSGKTELLESLMSLPYNMHAVATLTEASLLSGSPKREKAADASGGLLRAIGGFGFLILKDVTSILAMGGEVRGPLLAALREIHDGHWTRYVGVDGGRTLAWSGKCALVGGCTPAIDQHHTVMGMMGERFLLMRMPKMGEEQQADAAMKHSGLEEQMRRELRNAVSEFFREELPRAAEFDNVSRKRMAALATFVAHARSAVERDRYHREIELIPDSEMPGRLARTLCRLFQGLEVIGVGRQECWKLTSQVALDCVPDVRRKVLVCLAQQSVPVETSAVADAIAYPTTTVRRVLEDLTGHRLVSRFAGDSGSSHKWQITSLSKELLGRAEASL